MSPTNTYKESSVQDLFPQSLCIICQSLFPKYLFFHSFLAAPSSCQDLKHIRVFLDLKTPLVNTQVELQCSPSTWILNEQSITTKIQ